MPVTLPHHGRSGIVVGRGQGRGSGKRVILKSNVDNKVSRADHGNGSTRTEGQDPPRSGAGARLPQ